jgi:hypothetical protein
MHSILGVLTDAAMDADTISEALQVFTNAEASSRFKVTIMSLYYTYSSLCPVARWSIPEISLYLEMHTWPRHACSASHELALPPFCTLLRQKVNDGR